MANRSGSAWKRLLLTPELLGYKNTSCSATRPAAAHVDSALYRTAREDATWQSSVG